MSEYDELVERAAISLFEASYRYNGLGEPPRWQECSYQANEKWRTLACATISAIRPGDSLPGGLVVVPEELTDAIYRAMLSAAKEDE